MLSTYSQLSRCFSLTIVCQFVAPLARFAVAKIELFLNTIQIKSKSRAQVRLNKGIREAGIRRGRRLDGAYITARGWDEGPPKSIGAAL